MVRASALLDGITAPVDSGFSIHERMNCISSSRRRLFLFDADECCEGIDAGSRVPAAEFAARLHGYRAAGEGSRWLLGMAAHDLPRPVEKLLDLD